MADSKPKAVRYLFPAVQRAHWVGDGFHVRPVFEPKAFSPDLSPFLMFDYGEPKEFPPTYRKLGVGMHPHRGFETVTIALQGEVEHGDNKGNGGVIGPGDVQWMTAGSGIFHEEFHSRKFAQEGGSFEMLQLWVNLPAKLKMVTPKYQGLESKDIPTVALPDNQGTVKVIAGQFQDVKGSAETDFFDEEGKSLERGNVELWQIDLNQGADVSLPVKEGDTSILFVRNGAVTVNGQQVLAKHRLVLLTLEGNSIELSAPEQNACVFLLGGTPIRGADGKVEPIAAHGPMVMNTQQEIQDAMRWAYKEQSRY